MKNKNLSWYSKAWNCIKEKICSLFQKQKEKSQQKNSSSNKNKLKDGSISQVEGRDIKITYNIYKRYYNYTFNHRGEKRNGGKKCKFSKKKRQSKNSYKSTLLRKNSELRKKKTKKYMENNA